MSNVLERNERWHTAWLDGETLISIAKRDGVSSTAVYRVVSTWYVPLNWLELRKQRNIAVLVADAHPANEQDAEQMVREWRALGEQAIMDAIHAYRHRKRREAAQEEGLA